ncbi:hypothetical protein AAFF_G00396640 [Aldrovandia affinis]|uniref:Ig-like domain-containing protein n=1 Tax=Aldrovandia affinis TaxID=143900 RepID=A0AAD7VZ63_9TELE|nr:hypothetical protein AAFF_G00396640 [Aldrovandia affinis]
MRRTAVFLVLVWVSGVCVSSAQSEVKELKCIVGERVTFKIKVKESAFIHKNGESQIAKVVKGHFEVTDGTFSGRLQWDSSTEFFYITGLNMEDSGEYRVEDRDKKKDFKYKLAVYNPVSRPQVSSRNKMNPTCSVLCSVQNRREVTLSWQREGETLSHTSSPDLSTLLSLSLEIENSSAPYSCVVKNPVSNQTVTVKAEEYCFDPVSRPQVSSRNKMNPTCSVLCSVQNGREVTLSWQREGKTLNHTSSPDLSTLLSLPLEIEYNSAPYSCVVNNPGSNQMVTVKPEEYCFGETL